MSKSVHGFGTIGLMATSSQNDGSNAKPADRHIHTTHWSLVLAAGHRSSSRSNDALAALCRTYWYPLYAYVRRRVRDVDEAQDLTQGFFSQLLEKNYLAVAQPERGRFRAFLLTSLLHDNASKAAFERDDER